MNRTTTIPGRRGPDGKPRADRLPPVNVPDAHNGVLDPDWVGSAARVEIPLATAMVAGTVVILKIVGEPGTWTEFWQDERLLEEPDLQDPLLFSCPAAVLRRLDGGYAEFDYRVRTATGELRSEYLKLDIRRGAGPRPMPAATLYQADGDDTVDPRTANSLSVYLPPNLPVQPGDSADVTFAGSSEEGTQTIHVAEPAPQYRINFPASLLAFSLKKFVTISYVIRRGSRVLPSEEYKVFVKGISDYDERLSRMVITEAKENGLDLRDFPGDPHITMPPPIAFHPGMRYWLAANGKTSDGQPTRVEIANGALLGAFMAQLPLGTLPRSWLVTLENNWTFVLELSIAYDGAASAEGAVKFRSLTTWLRGVPTRAGQRGNQPDAERLPAVRVPDSYNNQLDPYATASQVRIEVPLHASMAVGTLVVIKMVGEPGTSAEFWREERTLAENDLRDPLVFHCPAAILQPLDGGEASFDYRVTTATEELRSDFLDLKIRRGAQNSPREPDVEAAVGDVLRADDLKGGPARVSASGHTGVAGNTLRMLWIPAEGEAFATEWKTLETDGQTLLFEIPFDKVNGSPGRVDVRYELKRGDAPAIPSRTRGLEVIAATVAPPLPAPVVVQADDKGVIDPLAARVLEVKIPDEPPIPTGTTLQLLWQGSTAPGSFAETIASPAAGMVVSVPLGVLAHNLGHAVQVTYKLVRGDEERESEERIVTVQPIAGESPALPSATFSQASDTELDMGSFVGEKADLTIERFPLATDGQRYWLRVDGQRDDGSAYTVTIAEDKPITNSDSPILLLGEAARSALEQFADGSEITIAFSLTFDQSDDLAHAVRFPLRKLTIRQAPVTGFPAMTVKETGENGKVDPLTVKTLTGCFPTDVAFNRDDEVEVLWTDHAGKVTWTRKIDGPAPGLEVPLDLYLLGYSWGRSATIQYRVSRRGQTYLSDSRSVPIEIIPDHSPLLPTPAITEVRDGILDLASLVGDAHSTISDVPLYSPLKQRYWTHLIGGGGTLEPAVGLLLDGTDPTLALESISRAWLEGRPDGSEVILLFTLAFDANESNPNNHRVFPEFRFSIRKADQATRSISQMHSPG